MDKKEEAYRLARRAVALDFGAALHGLLAGHAATLEDMRERLSKKDAALLASLALSRKGARINACDGLARTVREGIGRSDTLSYVERDFLAQTKPQ